MGWLTPAQLPDKLRTKIYVEPNTGCWLWTGRLLLSGYPAFDVTGPYFSEEKRQQSVQVRAHRMMYEMYVGGIEGELDHLCQTKCCVNPAHLEDVSHTENVRRKKQKQNHHKMHCVHGHEYAVTGFTGAEWD
jgi:hypothetical protein